MKTTKNAKRNETWRYKFLRFMRLDTEGVIVATNIRSSNLGEIKWIKDGTICSILIKLHPEIVLYTSIYDLICTICKNTRKQTMEEAIEKQRNYFEERGMDVELCEIDYNQYILRIL